MLPRKRAGEEGVVVEEETDNGSTSVVINNNNSSVQNVGASFIKKQRIDSDSNSNTNVAAVATVPTTASNIVNDAASLIMASGNSNPPDIDEDLHSRQLAVYGRETMRKLFASNVLISGMQGLGAEIAKNVILAGVKSVTLHDEGVVELWDLSSNFVFSESDVGKNRALASAQKLQDLNNSVIVHTLTSKLVKEQLSDFEEELMSSQVETKASV